MIRAGLAWSWEISKFVQVRVCKLAIKAGLFGKEASVLLRTLASPLVWRKVTRRRRTRTRTRTR